MPVTGSTWIVLTSRTCKFLAATLLSGSLMVAGCGSPTASEEGSTATSAGSGAASVQLHVLAAASLRKAFTDIGKSFESTHAGTTVEFTFAGSSDLVTQLTQGAPADVLATADSATMDKAWKAHSVINPVDFAANTLTIVVAPGNPKGIGGFADLARPGLDVVVCAPQVPCGAAAAATSKEAGVQLNPVSEESSVTDVLNKVIAGQADAGLVYFTDAKAAGDKVTAVRFPEAQSISNTYPIAVTSNSRNPERANQFIETVNGDVGHQILAAAGFSAP
ncbi:molybdate ABC transporter substrate-binding protein [Mycobacteroides immunogenum]|uniref:Molybdate-binding protein n=1 Tax=Mycobacteroides immunogenum TaxID=83262 RepID=A0A7V8LMC1_9MYCO|nr:molybdate ABC transporter substrate-binding protein [Mycobacteroides immunogenum]AMT71078.1 molybdate-binding protein [Mycobacteroides immunogenum]ANO04185.1 molybdate ABC transporter substrate-binding protein [Mycobacteroides immunogenum]KIU39108.1 molybdate-binding protein [Mycobacteroides immunogenum]KPG04968.1 molybdate-binding protein [Mycobacteroides immunogenum]KPG06779.1 molybdate-binding protein [Mycobacteroides immunogenum]